MRVPQSTAEPIQADNPTSSTLTPQHDDINAGLSAEDIAHNEEVLDRLRQTLEAFQGDRPFHNYTKRQRYIPGKNKPQRGYQSQSRKRGKPMESTDEASPPAADPAAILAEAEPGHSTAGSVEESTAGVLGTSVTIPSHCSTPAF